jgi:hypothetical protein
LFGGTDKTYDKPQPELPMFRPRFESGTAKYKQDALQL